jgi:YkoY family integral membrane protein
MLDQVFHSSLDMGIETPFMLLILVSLEAVLSADNAIALAAIAEGLKEPKLQKTALNIGLLIAYVLRISLIITATWVIKYWQFQLLGALYLLWLVARYFTSAKFENEETRDLNFNSLWQAIPMIGITDLAFSLDSVTAAIAISDEIWLIIAGGTIGVITLRFLAELFIRWIEEYTHLEDAGFITVGLVGLRLLLRVVKPELVPPEWMMVGIIVGMFIWGFSQKKELSPLTQEINSSEETKT